MDICCAMKKLQKISEEIIEMRKEMTMDICCVMKRLQKISEEMKKDREKMMEGFRCIEKAFNLVASVTQTLGEDLSVATGTIQIDPWAI